ncbi:MAG: DNA polymerase I [Desulfobacterium sp.]|nr:DNA polymerase I [Desulfobacterium sp.]
MKPQKTIYLIDGTAYIYRAYHAIRNLSNSKGFPTNAIFGFTKMILKLMDTHKPEHAAMFFDVKGPTFRHEIYPAYKANRPPMPDDLSAQIPCIKKIAEGFNIPVIEKTGFEADDLIGTIAGLAEKAGFSVVMVTGDKDFMQLVTEHSHIWDPMKDKIIDIQAIQESHGVEPRKMIDIMGLSGDSADNIPGVPGIGPKTAISLIRAFGSMDQLYEQVETISQQKQKENLIHFREQAFLSRKLVSIDTNVPVQFDPDQFRLPAPDKKALSELFREFEFRQLQQVFPLETDLSDKRYLPVLDMEALDHLVSELGKQSIFALDTETTSKNSMKAKLVGLSFSYRENEAWYIPVAHDYENAPEQLSVSIVLKRLRPVLESEEIRKIGQNIKYDWMVLLRHGVTLRGVVFDTMLASYLLSPAKRAHSLDQIALDYLDHRMISYEEVAGKGKTEIGFSKVPVDKAIPYACEDADITFLAYRKLYPMLQEAGTLELLKTVEMPLIPVLMHMEYHGIMVDVEKLKELSLSFEERMLQIEFDIYRIAGEEFNIRSTQQLGTILFEKLNLPVQKKTKKKTGYSTDVEVLTSLAEKHELPALVLMHRTLAKLKSTYADALVDLIHPETGRIHTSYNQTITATGRLSSSDPNLQNIPIRGEEGKEIRKAFIPQTGWSLVSADYSQIELRILAHCSNDPILIESFINDEDIHTRTASEVFQVFPSFITPEVRNQAKAINFGIIYGMSPFGLSKALGISQKMAKTYIDNYFLRYSGVRDYIEDVLQKARKNRISSTLLGRIRHIPDIDSENKNLRGVAERIAINTIIQGTAADLIKLAMIQVDDALTKGKYRSIMILSVHDELVFEVPDEELAAISELVKHTMEGVWDLKVPLKVNIQSGRNWAEAH